MDSYCFLLLILVIYLLLVALLIRHDHVSEIDLIRPIQSSGLKTISYPQICSRRNTNKINVAICAIAKYEDLYIHEFIDYYTALGVCDFYFYDNSDEFTLTNVIQNSSLHSTNPLVTLFHYPGRVMQLKAHNDCVQRAFRDSFIWAAFYDLDEFLVLKKHPDITSFIHDHGTAGGIVVNWILFGSSNQTEYKPIPVSKRFQYRQPQVHPLVKSILRLSDEPHFMNDPHFVQSFRNNASSYSVDTSGKIMKDPMNGDGPNDVALIHHFKTKSMEEYINRRKHGRADWYFSEFCADVNKTFYDHMNDPAWIGTVFDDSMWQVLKRNFPEHYQCILFDS